MSLVSLTQAIATFLSLTLFLAPLRDFLPYTRPQSTLFARYIAVFRNDAIDVANAANSGPNAIPFFCMLLSTLLWTSYGLLKSDSMLIVINAIGLLLSLFYLRKCFLIMVLKHVKENAAMPSASSGSSVVLDQGEGGASLSGAAKLDSSLNSSSLDTKTRIFLTKTSIPILIWLFALAFCFLWNENISEKLGMICMGASMVLFASPLAELRSVMRTRNSSSISAALTTAQILNCGSWVAYGVLIGDIYIVLPNLIGMGLGMLAVGVKRHVESTGVMNRKGGILP